jgi:hypothetical protein
MTFWGFIRRSEGGTKMILLVFGLWFAFLLLRKIRAQQCGTKVQISTIKKTNLPRGFMPVDTRMSLLIAALVLNFLLNYDFILLNHSYLIFFIFKLTRFQFKSISQRLLLI